MNDQMMQDVFPRPEIVPATRLKGHIRWLGLGDGEGLRSRPVDWLELDFAGAVGDKHTGHTRDAGAREPWYPRGSAMGNWRQLTLISTEELDAVRQAMDLPRLDASWIGANAVVAGIPHFTFLPVGTRLFFESGAVILVMGQNAPCRFAGREIANEYPDREGLDLLFVKAAGRLRGVVAVVERAGVVEANAAFEARLPEQWVYA
ncbi:putative metal-sulfur cluster biosynthesis proteins YuaD [Hartmannibacter diazotrophicus]|uniref:Putative metal-sulfur cluster biosynthesis proteins YuaD n=1 Tax=Hartmannibacter diazotrophicus TaxID=1482074 RepID=A0A2C9DBQ0_9HYPH|nr:molybdenum cofactor sulfurase [Hartmannibacter diazotrophicus]SON57727.1 putative metal-sulfur cluster biosynthesis proteins YuaD [Hartmannibacter diazotrophicus]